MTSSTDRLDALRIDRQYEDVSSRPRGLLLVAGIGLLGIALLAAGLWFMHSRATVVRIAVVREAAGGPAGPRTVLNASGYVTARRQATVSSRITGRVSEVLFEEGTVVHEGQVLARLNDDAIRVQLDHSEAQLAAARRKLAETDALLHEARLRLGRIEGLTRQEFASQAELDAVRAEAESLAARLETGREEIGVAEKEVGIFRQQLDDTVIRAPFSGVAISKNAQPGEMISPMSAGGSFTRTGICTLVDMNSLETEVDVNESYIGRVRPGQKVQATLDAYPGDPFPARVITTIPAADRQKATVKVRIGFDSLDPRILPDMGVKVAFLEESDTGGGGASARRLYVPRSAVRQVEGKDVVFVERDGRAERRAVKVDASASSSEEAEITAGLTAGERVVVDPPAALQEGNRITGSEGK